MIPVDNKKSAGLGGPGWESPGNKLQIPNSKLQRSTKLQAQKPTCAPFAPASVFGVCGLRFGTSLELGVWCLVFRSAAAQKLRGAAMVPEERGLSFACWLRLDQAEETSSAPRVVRHDGAQDDYDRG